MHDLARVEKFLQLCSRWIALIGLVGLVGLTLATIADVLMRWLFNSPIEGVHDLYGLVIAVIIGSFFPITLIEKHHISITFLGKAIGGRIHAFLNNFANIALLIFLILMSWQLINYVFEVIDTGETTWVLMWSIAPWWIVTTGIIIFCIPVQLFVTVRDTIVPPEQALHGHNSPTKN